MKARLVQNGEEKFWIMKTNSKNHPYLPYRTLFDAIIGRVSPSIMYWYGKSLESLYEKSEDNK